MILICIYLTLIRRLFVAKLRYNLPNFLQRCLRLLSIFTSCIKLIFSTIYHVSRIAQIVWNVRSIVWIKRSGIRFRSYTTWINLLDETYAALTHVACTWRIVADLTRWWQVSSMARTCVAECSEVTSILINIILVSVIHSI